MAIILRIKPKYKQYEMKPCKHFSSNGTFLYKNMIRVIDYCSGHNYCDMYLFLYTYIGVDGRERITFNLWKLMPFIDRLASKGPKIATWLTCMQHGTACPVGRVCQNLRTGYMN